MPRGALRGRWTLELHDGGSMFERTEPFARGQAARKLDDDDGGGWYVLGEAARWETDRPQPAEDRCSTILPVAPLWSGERLGPDPPDMWLDDCELEGDTPCEPLPGGPDTIPMPFDPSWVPTVRP